MNCETQTFSRTRTAEPAVPEALQHHLAIPRPARGLQWHRELGRLLAAMRPEKHHGEQWLAGVLKATGLTRDIAYKALAFFENFDDKEVQLCLDLGLTWSSVVALQRVKERTLRQDIYDQLAQHGVSVRSVRAVIEQMAPDDRAPRGGARPKPPRSRSFGLNVADMSHQIRRLNHLIDAITWGETDGLIAKLRSSKPGDLPNCTLKSLSEATAEISPLVERLQDLEPILKDALEVLYPVDEED